LSNFVHVMNDATTRQPYMVLQISAGGNIGSTYCVSWV